MLCDLVSCLSVVCLCGCGCMCVFCVFAELVYVCVKCACSVCDALCHAVWYVVCGCVFLCGVQRVLIVSLCVMLCGLCV